MDTIELQCTIHHHNKEKKHLSDILIAQLAQLGYYSFVDTDEGLKAYIEEEKFNYNDIMYIPVSPLFQDIVEINYRPIKDKNWNEEWEKNFSPVIIENKCVIRAPFHDMEQQYDHEIIIEPKMSFGTGHHATTYLMIKKLLNEPLNGKKVLDMGCGTGILAILSAQKGASKICAIDNDEWAFENAKENIEMNKVTNIQVFQGNSQSIPETDYDVILANINRNILLQDIPVYSKKLKEKGKLLLSGVYENDLHHIRDKAEKHQLQYISHEKDNEWIVVEFVKKNA